MKLIVTSMRNEGPFILEWIAYHRLIGFDHFLIYSNDCDDGSDALLDRLDGMGLITHVKNQTPEGQSIQWHAFKQASQHVLTKKADWVMVLDVDEFVNIQTGDGTIDDLIKMTGEADAIALTWRLFGNSDHLKAPNGLVSERYTKCAKMPFLSDPYQAMIKTVFRNNGLYQQLGVHRPKKRDQDARKPIWVNGSGTGLSDIFLDRAIVTYGKNCGTELAYINHYSVKSVETFMIKAERGLANQSNIPIDCAYWAKRNCNEEVDLSLTKWAPQIKSAIEDILGDAQLLDCYSTSLKWHQKRGKELWASEKGRTLAWSVAGIERKSISF